MKTLNDNPSRFRRSLLLGFLLALGASAASQAQDPDRVRTTASTGIFTLVPRQTVRLHLVDVGRSTALSSRVRFELRDDRGTLIGSLRPTTLRPGTPVHLVLRSTTLLGSRPFLYVRAIAILETDLDNPESAPIFTVEAHPEAPGGMFITTEVKCPLQPRDMDDPQPHGPVYSIDGDCEVVDEVIPRP